jgi:uncharacterized protein (TIGR02594 family)
MLPDQYKWLLDEPGPRMLKIGLADYGVFEAPGAANNPLILGWQRELQDAGIGRHYGSFYSSDAIPWCGLWMAVVAHRANPERRPEREPPRDYLAAISWRDWGKRVPAAFAALGDVLVFRRQGGNHVAIYIGEDDFAIQCLGANQRDRVFIAGFPRDRLIHVRRPAYRIQPPNVRPIKLNERGWLSTSEA